MTKFSAIAKPKFMAIGVLSYVALATAEASAFSPAQSTDGSDIVAFHCEFDASSSPTSAALQTSISGPVSVLEADASTPPPIHTLFNKQTTVSMGDGGCTTLRGSKIVASN